MTDHIPRRLLNHGVVIDALFVTGRVVARSVVTHAHVSQAQVQVERVGQVKDVSDCVALVDQLIVHIVQRVAGIGEGSHDAIGALPGLRPHVASDVGRDGLQQRDPIVTPVLLVPVPDVSVDLFIQRSHVVPDVLQIVPEAGVQGQIIGVGLEPELGGIIQT